MTLHEIEETLDQLSSRHSSLDEAMLVTLLRSGGWEEKNIQEALMLFRSGGAMPRAEEAAQKTIPLPPLQEEPTLMPPVDENHLLEEGSDDLSREEEKQETAPSEPQSLVEPVPEPVIGKKEELPHNLPLRPFETSEHIWPFSRYKDVFYGETEPESQPVVAAVPEAKKEESKVETTITETSSAPSQTEVKKEETIPAPVATLPPSSSLKKGGTPASLTKGDEKLIVIACGMLVIILLLLGYMYSNGRL